ncbi:MULTISPECIES: trypsin-like peptidase domain-containing protein [unclassified Streptomyces]|uniref:S1C family serine protease n=1 Tax=unclassified Streptomyces TaxID=2593676 RepID=UPI0036FFE25D
MNEGKPTQGPSAQRDDRTDGTEENAAAADAHAAPAADGQGTGLHDPEADFELARPGARHTGAGEAPADGDYELSGPARVGEDRPGAGDVQSAAGEDGPGAAEVQGTAAAAPAERPRPLHDPDPYNTPPYGEPGPWAPAPPVQHPAATPSHGTLTAPAAAPQPPTVPPTAAPQPPTAPHAMPAPQPPVPPHAPAAGGPAPTAAPVTPAPTAALVAPVAPGAMAAPVAPGTSAPMAAPVAPGASAPMAAPVAPGTPAPTAAPVPPATPAPASTTVAVPPPPASGTPATPGAPADPAAPPASPTSPPAAPEPPSPTPDATGPADQASASAAPADPADPWHRYDPWAAPAGPAPAPGQGPLQQTGAAVDTVQQRRRRQRRGAVVFVVALALVSGAIGGVVGAYLERNGGLGTSVELPQAGDEPAGRAPDSVAGIAARALPSVVTLHVTGTEESGTGTGFVLDTRGHILTNNHVVEPAGTGGEITVAFNGGETAKAKVVGRDSGYDLAVVQVTGVKGLRPLPLGNSDNVRVGDPVVAIGAPFDLAGTVTSGIISAKERPITAGGEKGDGSDVSYVDALQTDAPINPGNSGGPLLDGRGQVVGINSAIRSADSAGGGDPEAGGQAGSIGLGFAIPINQGKRVAEELINTGHATHPVIGITLDMDFTGDGARVGAQGNDGGPSVTPGGPGAKAGIKPGDVITAVDGQRVHSGEELIVKTRAHRPGDSLELTVERGGQVRKVSLVLGSAGGD